MTTATVSTDVKEPPKKDPEAQGAHMLKSYLSALRIPHSNGKKPNEVVVTGKKGSQITVVVGEGEGRVKLDPAVITSFELTKALSALHAVTTVAGYGKPSPLNRGAAPDGRISFNDNFEDVYLRHSAFRRSPNLSAEKMEPYMATIKSQARKALWRWRVFPAIGFGEEDLITAGMVYTTSFIHHYAYAADHIDNIKLLTDYLKQRFGEMAKICNKKALNATCLPQAVQPNSIRSGDEEETSYIDTFAESEEASPDDEYEEDQFVLTYPDKKERTLKVENDGMLGLRMIVDGRILTKGEATQLTEDIRSGKVGKRYVAAPAPVVETEASQQTRKNKAYEELLTKLKALSPEDRKIKLGYAALSRDYSPDARREARKLCDELVCPKCQKRVASGVHCINCEVAAVPLLGVDYMAFREELKAEQHPMAEAMSAAVPESEQRARAKRPPAAPGTQALADVKNEKPQEIRKVVPSMNKEKIVALSKKMADELMETLPAKICCPKCKVTKRKDEFGIRVARNKATGIPDRASRQSYCKACRKPA